MSEPTGQPETQYVTCHCDRCGGGIEFDASQFLEEETLAVECPHCHAQTTLAPSARATPPPIQRLPLHPLPLPPVIQEHDGRRRILLAASWSILCLLSGVVTVSYLIDHRPEANPFGAVVALGAIWAVVFLPMTLIKPKNHSITRPMRPEELKLAAQLSAAATAEAEARRKAAQEAAAREAAAREAAAKEAVAADRHRKALALLLRGGHGAPSTDRGFCGQGRLLAKIVADLEAAHGKRESPPNVLLIGAPGSGKTALGSVVSRAFAEESAKGYKCTCGESIGAAGDLAGLLTNIDEGDILFIDDLDRADTTIQEYLSPAIVDHLLHVVIDQGPDARSVRLNLPHFTLVATATRKERLSPLMLASFSIIEEMDSYTTEEITEVTRWLAKGLGLEIDEGAVQLIANAAEGNPKEALARLNLVRVFAKAKGLSNRITVEVAAETSRMLLPTEQGKERGDAIPSEVRRAVWRRDGGKCSRCGSREKLEYDHIVPRSKGGSNTSRNVELLCEACNRKKSNSIL